MTHVDEEAEVIIIGTGFSGLGLGVALKREGKRDFIMLERAHDVGGTWRDNTYPGAACDIQSHLYSYSFRPNPNWSRVYCTQPEIHDYLRETAKEEGLLSHIRFGCDMNRAVWEEDSQTWRVETGNGTFRARSLVAASGHLSDPSYPDIPGLDSFEGQIFHSARWDHDAELAGKRVGLVGTGASSIQIVPELAGHASHLTVFQRTPPYIVPRRDYFYSPAEKGMFARFPETMQAIRDELFWGNEARFPQRRQVPAFIDQVRATALAHLADQVEDPVLRAKLTPQYEIGCKRLLISNDYFPALARPDVTLETAGIERITPEGVVTRDGTLIQLDTLIVATGFEAARLPIAELIEGRGGQTLADRWSEGGAAFACATIDGFPNFFMMLGPNTGVGAGSIIYMVETQVNYIQEGLAFIHDKAMIVEPTPQAAHDYVESIYKRAEGTVWTSGGCKSWYLDPESGKLTTLWPDFMTQFRRENGSFSSVGYDIQPVRIV